MITSTTNSRGQSLVGRLIASLTKVHSIAVSAVTCAPDGTSATILGTATVDGVGLVGLQINVTDLGQPGRSDTYQLLLSTGYDTGVQLLRGGNVRVHTK